MGKLKYSQCAFSTESRVSASCSKRVQTQEEYYLEHQSKLRRIYESRCQQAGANTNISPSTANPRVFSRPSGEFLQTLDRTLIKASDVLDMLRLLRSQKKIEAFGQVSDGPVFDLVEVAARVRSAQAREHTNVPDRAERWLGYMKRQR